MALLSLAEAVEGRGYAVIQDGLTNSECEGLLEVLATRGAERSRAGARHLMSLRGVADLASDPRLLAIAATVLHGAAVPFRATLFDKSRIANWSVVWHQDTALPVCARFDMPGWGPWSSKAGILYAHAPSDALERVLALRVHLDASLEYNGPLRVLPGTHTRGVLSDDQVEQIAHSEKAESCLVMRGGILAMRPLLIHSSPRIDNTAPRRVLHIEYADSLLLAPGIKLATA